MDYDFSGWVTRNDIQCSDGRTIMKDAFKHNDGQTVPLVWNHQHNSPDNVLGHVLLENRDQGVYGYGKFNETEAGVNAKMLVRNGDVDKLSIYANKLKSQKNNVFHGCIREVSLVLAGANPGAYIDSIVMHGEGADAEEEGTIYTDEPITVATEQSDESENEEVVQTEESVEETIEHSDEKNDKEESKKMEEKENDKTVEEVFNTLTEEQKTAVYAIVGQALEDNENYRY